MSKILVFDTETTGVRFDDEVLTLAVIDALGNVLVDDMYRPRRKLAWQDAEKINGISPAMTANSPSILAKKEELEELFNDPTTLLVGYNIEFDIKLLKQSGIIITNPHRYDVMQEFSKFRKVKDERRGGYRWWKLVECAEFYGYDWGSSKAHGALADTKATLYCYNKLNYSPQYEEISLF